MMYRNNFVAVIKNKGRVLRENSEGVVRLPFGSHYTVTLKNKDSRQAVVNVEIDDREAATGIIVPANSTVELKGFLEGMRVKNKFKFIQKTKKIQQYRGDRLGDGLVRVEYRYERRIEIQPPIWPQPIYPIRPLKGSGVTRDVSWTYSDSSTSDILGASNEVHCYNVSSNPSAAPKSDEGITVKGKKTNQNFTYGWTAPLESQSTVIILHLKGANRRLKKVGRPITVKTRFRCSTCGTVSKSNAKFCRDCGTYLE